MQRRQPVLLPPVASPLFTFAHDLPFTPEDSAATLRHIPEAPGVLALFGPETQPATQPFLTRTTNLRRRAARLLNPPAAREQTSAPDGTPLPSRRLNLRDRVARVAFSTAGSEFESLLLLYHATAAFFGLDQARRRLRLSTPFFVRFSAENAFPRLYVTNRLSTRSLRHTFGPFPSRLAAERYAEAVLDLFSIRRCWQELDPAPDFPGCVYGEMHKCLSPCNLACTPDAYSAEALAAQNFLLSRGESLLAPAIADRERASEDMDFERAADLHRQVEKIKATIALADPIVAPLASVSGLIVQPASLTETEQQPEQAALFLLHAGCLVGPQLLSTLGVRAVREQTSVGSSLFAQPLMLAAVPLPPDPVSSAEPATALAPTSPAQRSDLIPLDLPPHPLPGAHSPEDRAQNAIASLSSSLSPNPAPDLSLLSDHLALFRRWYFRPEKQRSGAFLPPNPDGTWPVRRLLNAAARAALGTPKPMQATDRDAARTLKTKLLHPGRDGVERTVPVIPRRPAPPAETAHDSAEPTPFRSRRTRSRTPTAAPAPADKLPLS